MRSSFSPLLYGIRNAFFCIVWVSFYFVLFCWCFVVAFLHAPLWVTIMVGIVGALGILKSSQLSTLIFEPCLNLILNSLFHSHSRNERSEMFKGMTLGALLCIGGASWAFVASPHYVSSLGVPSTTLFIPFVVTSGIIFVLSTLSTFGLEYWESYSPSLPPEEVTQEAAPQRLYPEAVPLVPHSITHRLPPEPTPEGSPSLS